MDYEIVVSIRDEINRLRTQIDALTELCGKLEKEQESLFILFENTIVNLEVENHVS